MKLSTLKANLRKKLKLHTYILIGVFIVAVFGFIMLLEFRERLGLILSIIVSTVLMTLVIGYIYSVIVLFFIPFHHLSQFDGCAESTFIETTIHKDQVKRITHRKQPYYYLLIDTPQQRLVLYCHQFLWSDKLFDNPVRLQISNKYIIKWEVIKWNV